jgi:hypothetical protein
MKKLLYIVTLFVVIGGWSRFSSAVIESGPAVTADSLSADIASFESMSNEDLYTKLEDKAFVNEQQAKRDRYREAEKNLKPEDIDLKNKLTRAKAQLDFILAVDNYRVVEPDYPDNQAILQRMADAVFKASDSLKNDDQLPQVVIQVQQDLLGARRTESGPGTTQPLSGNSSPATIESALRDAAIKANVALQDSNQLAAAVDNNPKQKSIVLSADMDNLRGVKAVLDTVLQGVKAISTQAGDLAELATGLLPKVKENVLKVGLRIIRRGVELVSITGNQLSFMLDDLNKRFIADQAIDMAKVADLNDTVLSYKQFCIKNLEAIKELGGQDVFASASTENSGDATAVLTKNELIVSEANQIRESITKYIGRVDAVIAAYDRLKDTQVYKNAIEAKNIANAALGSLDGAISSFTDGTAVVKDWGLPLG